MLNILTPEPTSKTKWWRTAAVIAFAGLMFAAWAPVRASAAPVAGATPSPSSASGAAIVMARTGPAGTYLADGAGRTLYLFGADRGGTSACNGACAAAWPPLKTVGTPTAGAGVTASLLTTIKRSDGSTQVVYNGHPLYYFQGDTTVGSTAGQGLNAFGGIWWLVSPAGAAIQSSGGSSASPGPSAGSSSSGGGSGGTGGSGGGGAGGY